MHDLPHEQLSTINFGELQFTYFDPALTTYLHYQQTERNQKIESTESKRNLARPKSKEHNGSYLTSQFLGSRLKMFAGKTATNLIVMTTAAHVVETCLFRRNQSF